MRTPIVLHHNYAQPTLFLPR